MKENYEAVLNHLLFHKSIISEEDDSKRIDRYLDMVERIDKGMHIVVDDPFEKSIAAAFELVIEHKFDPWDINLREFTKMYLRQVKKEGYVNFVVAGKLILMAWSILKLQSEEVLVWAEPVKKEEEYYFGDWDLDATLYQEPEDLDFTHTVLNRPESPLKVPVRTKRKRQVTLIELVDAFNEARKEAELQMRISEIRSRARNRVPHTLGEKVHKENLTEDIAFTWERLSKCNGEKVTLRELCDGDVWDRITVFVSILFLAMMKKVRIWQRSLPYGEITIRPLISQEEKAQLLAEEDIKEELLQERLAVV